LRRPAAAGRREPAAVGGISWDCALAVLKMDSGMLVRANRGGGRRGGSAEGSEIL